MKNFAIWYEGDKDVNLDIHFNLWKLAINKSKFRNTGFSRALDIGLMIDKAENVKCINIFIPSKSIEKTEISDLSKVIIKAECLLNAIFNENLTNESGQHTNYIPVNNKQKPDNSFSFCKLDDEHQKLVDSTDGKIFTITLPESTDNDKKCGRTYLRLRIHSPSIFNPLDLETPKNSFLQAAFSKYETIDFRFNEFRGLPTPIYKKLETNSKFNIQKIHFLFICNSSEDYMLAHLPYKSCRHLEDSVWDEYLKELKSVDKSLITYHWKEKASEGRDLESFNALIKTRFTHTNIKTLLKYLGFIFIITLIFNLVSNKVYDLIKQDFDKKENIETEQKSSPSSKIQETKNKKDSIAD